MKKSAFFFFSVSLFFCIVVLLVRSGSVTKIAAQAIDDSREFAPHELLVRLKEASVGDLIRNQWLVRNIISQVQGRIKTYLNEEKGTLDWDPSELTNRSFHSDPYLFHILVPEEIELDYAIRRLESNPYVEYAEKNGIACVATDDPYFSEQWGLANIHAEEAWAISTGNSEVVVAVLDTGLDYEHEDILGNLWENPNEIPGDGQDNDHNGFTDDVKGWNFFSGYPPGSADPMDDQTHLPDAAFNCVPTGLDYHGTHTAGIIGAVGNNDKGISGVCWNVKIMPIKIGNYCGQVLDDRIINGIDYATNNGAFLTNNSYRQLNDNYSNSVKLAIARAQEKSRLFVAAAGNENRNLDANPRYPACYPNENIIAVLATNDDDTKRSDSNYGQNSVDVGAPGSEIWSLRRGNDYRLKSGTSMAAPHVAGVAALALGVCPGLTYSRLKDLIVGGADYVASLNNKCVADGRLNAFNVLNSLGGSTPPNAPSNLLVYQIGWTILGLRWNDNSNNEIGFEIQRKDEYRPVFIHENCADMNSTPYAYCQDPIDTLRTFYSYRVRAVNGAGISDFSSFDFEVPQVVPDAPSDLSGQSPTLEQNVNISWSNQYRNPLYNYVERRIPGITGWSVIATVGYNVDSYSDDGAQAGNTYEYRVRAGNPIGYSTYSNILSIEVIEW